MNKLKALLDALQEVGIQSMENIAQQLGFDPDTSICLYICQNCHAQIICCVDDCTGMSCPTCRGTVFDIDFLKEEPEINDDDEIIFLEGKQLFGADIKRIKQLLKEMGKASKTKNASNEK